MDCAECGTILKDYKKSAKIPKDPRCHYIMCNSCGCVMIGRFKKSVLKEVKNTPKDNSKETHNMIMEAIELFASKDSMSNMKVSLTRHGTKYDIKDINKMLEPKETVKTIERSYSNECKSYENCPQYENKCTKMGILSRVKSLFKRMFRR